MYSSFSYPGSKSASKGGSSTYGKTGKGGAAASSYQQAYHLASAQQQHSGSTAWAAGGYNYHQPAHISGSYLGAAGPTSSYIPDSGSSGTSVGSWQAQSHAELLAELQIQQYNHAAAEQYGVEQQAGEHSLYSASPELLQHQAEQAVAAAGAVGYPDYSSYLYNSTGAAAAEQQQHAAYYQQLSSTVSVPPGFEPEDSQPIWADHGGVELGVTDTSTSARTSENIKGETTSAALQGSAASRISLISVGTSSAGSSSSSSASASGSAATSSGSFSKVTDPSQIKEFHPTLSHSPAGDLVPSLTAALEASPAGPCSDYKYMEEEYSAGYLPPPESSSTSAESVASAAAAAYHLKQAALYGSFLRAASSQHQAAQLAAAEHLDPATFYATGFAPPPSGSLVPSPGLFAGGAAAANAAALAAGLKNSGKTTSASKASSSGKHHKGGKQGGFGGGAAAFSSHGGKNGHNMKGPAGGAHNASSKHDQHLGKQGAYGKTSFSPSASSSNSSSASPAPNKPQPPSSTAVANANFVPPIGQGGVLATGNTGSTKGAGGKHGKKWPRYLPEYPTEDFWKYSSFGDVSERIHYLGIAYSYLNYFSARTEEIMDRQRQRSRLLKMIQYTPPTSTVDARAPSSTGTSASVKSDGNASCGANKINSIPPAELEEGSLFGASVDADAMKKRFDDLTNRERGAVAANWCVIRTMLELQEDLDSARFITSGVPNSFKVDQDNDGRTGATLKQLVRDWSEEGKEERDLAYKPLLDALEKYLPLTEEMKSGVADPRDHYRVSVPGCGLARLLFEVVNRGYCGEGNEFSWHMMMMGDFILNCCDEPNMYTIYPWATSYKEKITDEGRLKGIRIPDVSVLRELTNPKRTLPVVGFGMASGDFTEIYGRESQVGQWDAVLTCYFVDTARNIFLYIRTIAKMLRSGGVWANLGPLLWHFAETPEQHSIEVSYHELMLAVRKYFVIREDRDVPVGPGYNFDDNSTRNNRFRPKLFVGIRNKKPVKGESNPVYNEEM
ncbi:unnamed protein product [Amoebophrya sp. A120]|nr:unnamed protein product [Amoebophrya sp. A120]|eukprot:GSA120T00003630001.1